MNGEPQVTLTVRGVPYPLRKAVFDHIYYVNLLLMLMIGKAGDSLIEKTEDNLYTLTIPSTAKEEGAVDREFNYAFFDTAQKNTAKELINSIQESTRRRPAYYAIESILASITHIYKDCALFTIHRSDFSVINAGVRTSVSPSEANIISFYPAVGKVARDWPIGVMSGLGGWYLFDLNLPSHPRKDLTKLKEAFVKLKTMYADTESATKKFVIPGVEITPRHDKELHKLNWLCSLFESLSEAV